MRAAQARRELRINLVGRDTRADEVAQVAHQAANGVFHETKDAIYRLPGQGAANTMLEAGLHAVKEAAGVAHLLVGLGRVGADLDGELCDISGHRRTPVQSAGDTS